MKWFDLRPNLHSLTHLVLRCGLLPCLCLAMWTTILAEPASRNPFELDLSGFGCQVLEDGRWQSIFRHRNNKLSVVLVHGLDEPGQIWKELAPALASANMTAIRFIYPNDQSPKDSAELLGESMEYLRKSGVGEVALVGHSMGGLVCRDFLTSPAMYAANAHHYPVVKRLITVGTPNQGSTWAKFHFVSETREQIMRTFGAGDGPPSPKSDGHGEAVRDLLPGSDYLKELNARGLPATVPITIIAGFWKRHETKDSEVETSEPRWWRRLKSRLSKKKEDAYEKLGDGVVSLSSTRLDGVDDYILVPANHHSLLVNHGDSNGVAPGIAIIMKRLGL